MLNYINEFEDNDLSKEAKKKRYSEYASLFQLPFYSKEQRKRFKKLETLRKRDNRHGFENAGTH